MSDADSEPDAVAVPVSTSFLPDHLVSGGPTGVEAVSKADDSDETDDSDDDGTADAFCRSWQQHLTGGSTPF